MTRTTTLFLTSTLILGTYAQLAPQQSAPLSMHLQEVNAQWRIQNALPVEDGTEIAFADEAERIATHLRLVRTRLEARSPEGLSADQFANRGRLLDKLGYYADRGLFPKNHVLPFRNPVFIDPFGTACAVGQLMIESDRQDLAEQINSEMNLAYVMDMDRSDVIDWAVVNGFSEAELAWIQPGYPPSVPWAPLGGGTNGPVKVLFDLGDGQLVVAGSFTQAGGVVMNQVALWDGNEYAPLGSGISGEVNCAVAFEGDILLGGALLGGYSDLATWDGNSWSYSVVFDGKYPLINALHVHEGALFAAGEMSGFAGVDHTVKVRTMSGWDQVGGYFNEKIHTLGTWNDMLLAGGAFTQMIGLTGPMTRHIASYGGGGWSELAGGLDATVRSLIDVDGDLYAGGDLFTNVIPTFGLARIAMGSMAWENMLPGHDQYMAGGLGPSYIASLAAQNGMVYFGGQFTMEFLMIYGTNIASFNGTPDGIVPMALLDGEVFSVATFNDRLVMGGEFNLSLPHVASVDISTSVSDVDTMDERLSVYPQPARTELTVEFAGNDLSKAAIRVLDAEGRVVEAPIQRNGERVVVRVNGLAPGAYLVTVAIGDQGRTIRFIKE